MAARPSIKKICRTARMSKAPGHAFGYLRDLCESAVAKADANGYVIGPAGGRSKKTEVTAAVRREAAALRLQPKRRRKRR